MTELSCAAMMMDLGAPFREEEDIIATGFIVDGETWRERSKDG